MSLRSARFHRRPLGGYVDYDFANADFILSFGARLLEGWGAPCAMNRNFVAWKKKGAKLVQADTVRTRTASIADTWLPVKAGTEAVLALGIANYLAKKKGRAAGGADWMAIVDKYTPEKAAAITGLKAKDRGGRRGLLPCRQPGRDRWPRRHGRFSSSSAEFLAVQALNAMVGSRAANLKKSQGLGEPALSAAAAASLKDAKKLAGVDDFIKNGNFEMLFINEADPAYKSVYGAELAKKMEKAFVVAFMPLLNDTAMYADYIFPSLTCLEEETAGLPAPMKPYMKAVHSGDAVISIAKKVNDVKGSFPLERLRRPGQELRSGRRGRGASFNAQVLKDFLASLEKAQKSTDFPLSMVPVELTFVGDGDGLAFPLTC